MVLRQKQMHIDPRILKIVEEVAQGFSKEGQQAAPKLKDEQTEETPPEKK